MKAEKPHIIHQAKPSIVIAPRTVSVADGGHCHHGPVEGGNVFRLRAVVFKPLVLDCECEVLFVTERQVRKHAATIEIPSCHAKADYHQTTQLVCYLKTCERASTMYTNVLRPLSLDEISNEYSIRRWIRGMEITRSKRRQRRLGYSQL